MSDRYQVRRASGGFMVFDRRSGRAAFVQGRPQLGLKEERAEAVADSLNEQRVTLGCQPLPADLHRRTTT